MKRVILALSLAATPAFAEDKAFFSLANTDFVVTLGFIVFVGILIYFGVPGKVGAMLDARSAQIKADLAEARALRDEAKALLTSYERKQKDVRDQSERIIASAREEAMAAAAQAKADIARSIALRLAAAEDQIASAEASAMRQVRDHAVAVAIAAAGDILARQMSADGASASIDAAIAQVDAKLH